MQWSVENNEIKLLNDDCIYLDQEYIRTLTEYEPNSLAITCDMHENILNFVSGKTEPAEIQSADHPNIYKSFLEPFPGDPKEFPFLICTGNAQI